VDKGAVTNKVKAFIDAYNTAMTTMRTAVTEKKIAGAKTETDAAKGALYADSGVNQLMAQLRRSVGQTLSGIGNPVTLDQLSEIGITTGSASGSATFSQDAVNGKLVLDSTVLSNALDADPLSVQRLLGGMTGVSGFAQSFNGTLNPYTQTAGIIDSRVTGAGTEIKRYADTITSMDARLAQKERSLRAMFTSMELALQKAKSQGTDMLSRLGISSTTTR
jgi:flagellar hook-associated protein 2